MNRLIALLLFFLIVFQFSSTNAKTSGSVASNNTDKTLHANDLYLNSFSPAKEMAFAESEKLKSYTDKLNVASTNISVSWAEGFSDNNYFLYIRAWTEETVNGKTVQIQNGIYDFVKTTSGFSLKLKNPSGYLTYYAVDTINFDLGSLVGWNDTLSTIATKNNLNQFWSKADITEADTARWGTSGSGAIVSVNGQTGAVILNADEIDDIATVHKFTTQSDIDRLAFISGDNTGDQDTLTIPGLQEFVENHSPAGTPETDPVFTTWDKSSGINITESQISDLGNYLQTEVDASVSNEIQTIDVAQLNGTNLELSLSSDGQATKTVDLSGLAGGTTNLSYIQAATQGTVTSSTGTNAIIPLADGINAGLMSPEKFMEIDSISSGDKPLYKIDQLDEIDIKYGCLYNWYSVNDVRNLANTGWHMPSLSEYQTLISYLGGSTVAGEKLKEPIYWATPMVATNESNFNGKPGGSRRWSDGSFGNMTYMFNLWCSDSYNSTNGRWVYMQYADAATFIDYYYKYAGFSVRLIKESTTLSHGETGTYTGNDGKVYNTICIGTQEWLSENLAETQYQNGDPIPEVTDNTEWPNLTTGARCSYNNDETNAFANQQTEMNIGDVMYFDATIKGDGTAINPFGVDTSFLDAEVITDHALLTNLDYANSGHIGFEEALTFSSGLSRTGNTITSNDTEINHDSLLNAHNLTTDIDHNQLTNYDANRHFLQSEILISESQISDLGNYLETETDPVWTARQKHLTFE